MQNIWLFKSDTEDENYCDILQKSGFLSKSISPLTFEFCNMSALKDALSKPQNHSGIIFSSPRSVMAVSRIYQDFALNVHKEWLEKKMFVVGPSTGRKVEEELNFKAIGQEAGNAEQLVPMIIREVKAFDKPLLIPCGNLKSSFPKLLVQADLDFRAITVYETKPSPRLKETLCDLLPKEKPHFMVFFSPSGVEFSVSILKELKFDFTLAKVIAIGPTTNSALVKANLPVYGICPEPTPNGLIHVLKSR